MFTNLLFSSSAYDLIATQAEECGMTVAEMINSVIKIGITEAFGAQIDATINIDPLASVVCYSPNALVESVYPRGAFSDEELLATDWRM